MLKTNLGYDDVTKDWFFDIKSKRRSVKDIDYYETVGGIKYYVDGKNVVLDYSNEEKRIAKLLVGIFGGVIYMVPRINNPKGVQTADYLWNGEHWDLKSIKGNSPSTIDRTINGKIKQSKNFIIDISKSAMTTSEADAYIEKIYNSNYRFWVNKIILMNNNEVVKIYQRK